MFLLVDVDHFKAINDTHGHSAGDQVLVELARVLKEGCREADTVARWGGEEFLVVGRFTDRAQGAAQAERIRRSVADHAFAVSGGRAVPATCSVGFAAFPFAPAAPLALRWEQVVDIADYGAYVAKQSGRNRCVGLAVAPEGLPKEAPVRAALEERTRDGRLRVEVAPA